MKINQNSVFSLCLAALMLIWMPVTGKAETDGQPIDQYVVTGTLMKLDLAGMKGEIDTDLGYPIFFVITKPQLFKDLSVGTLVTIAVDNQGDASKVIAASRVDFLQLGPLDQTPRNMGQ